jgi:DNA (cytosine-5)-methyltransferase 1
VVKLLQPSSFLIENVVGLRDMRFVGHVCELFAELGYGVTPLVLTAADYGVPQLRRRVVFVGDKDGRSFLRPRPSRARDEYVTVWDAIGDLPELEPGQHAEEYDKPAATEYQRRMRRGSKGLQGHEASSHPEYLVRAISFIPDGGNRQAIPPRYQPKSGYHNSYSRLHSASPAVAVTQNMGKPSATRCIHPFQHRGLTAREGARLQGFPDSFHFLGPMCSQRLQIANAVPPILAEVLGEALVDPERWADRPMIESQYLLFRDRSADRPSAA